jgi:1-acylglycerone phosphate reductase
VLSVKQLTDRGYIVYATARKLSSLEGLAHASVRKHVLDVTSDQNVQQVVDAVIAETGRIDLLINNAGVLAPGPMADCTSEEIKAVYDTNVFGILRMCRTVLPHMAKRQSGTIVNIGSIVGELYVSTVRATDFPVS